MFFIMVYIHIARGLYYGSYKAPRATLWIVGKIPTINKNSIFEKWESHQ
jgi:quinol-cytochrome oxidoreductase complex cytochrome b subunit